ncbi:MAG: WecB/TagA/CpsF family glycosyltransferase, partial [Clostridiales bacterium]
MRVLNVRIDDCDMAACVAKIEMWLAAFHGQAGGMKQVITLNAEGVFIAKNDADFAALIESSDLVTPDGSGVVWAAKKYGYAGLARVAGIDLLEKLCAVGQDRDWSVYLLGGQPDIAALAGQNLLQRYPRLRIVGSENGYFREREQQVIEAINQAQPDLLFAGLGMPFQE